ncbi:sugar phosphate isomerase/epimerase [Candidatus Poribacteria bacterium]|nr:sugar phosphate isomerase/epimerase [Candidatus Poribacteria bacterium]
MEFAVCIWGLDKPEETAQDLSGQGVTAVESGPKFFIEKDEETIERAAQTFKEAGIRIFSVHAPFGEQENLSALDSNTRKNAIDVHRRLLEKIALVGAKVMIVHPGRHASGDDIPRMEEILPSSLEEVLKTAERTGVKLALENMLPEHPGYSSETVREIVEGINSPFLGVCFDTGHAHVNREGEIAAFDNLKDLIIAFHLQDNDSTRDMHLQPPYGTVNWDKLVPMIKELNFQDPMAVEAMPWGGASFGMLLKEIKALFGDGLVEVVLDGFKARAICPLCGRYMFRSGDGWFCGCGDH